LQKLSDKGLKVEGFRQRPEMKQKSIAQFKKKGLRAVDGVECLLAKGSFQSLWQSINGPESWNANPWVWVVEFERTEKPANWPK